MDYYQELICLIDIVDRAMASIIWRIIENEQTMYFTLKTRLGVDELSL
jgi:hypothetical protein